MSREMVKAIIDGRKTMTRRLIRPEWFRCLDPEDHDDMPNILAQCPYGAPGDRLWCRETVARENLDGDERIIWKADHQAAWASELGMKFYLPTDYKPARWTPSIHMPRALSRIDLEVTAVRVERLHDITEDDARAEGVTRENVQAILPSSAPLATQARDAIRGSGITTVDPRVWPVARDNRDLFVLAWTAINGKKAPWASNPFVWVVSFQRWPTHMRYVGSGATECGLPLEQHTSTFYRDKVSYSTCLKGAVKS
jgi:hypothetical protein